MLKHRVCTLELNLATSSVPSQNQHECAKWALRGWLRQEASYHQTFSDAGICIWGMLDPSVEPFSFLLLRFPEMSFQRSLSSPGCPGGGGSRALHWVARLQQTKKDPKVCACPITRCNKSSHQKVLQRTCQEVKCWLLLW